MEPEIVQLLQKWNQPALTRHFNQLDSAACRAAAEELRTIDPVFISELFAKFQDQQRSNPSCAADFSRILPLDDCFTELRTERIWGTSAEAETFLSSGKAAVVILAGGMGSRLGHSAPKGTFPITPVTGKSLFQVHFEKIALLQKRYSAQIRTYIMANRVSLGPTKEYLREKNWFGLSPDAIFFFTQNEMPALNPQDGSFFFLPDGRIYFGPDGHGGLITALADSGAGEDLRKHGIETIQTFHVDNPLVPILNEQFLAAHLQKKSEMSSIVVEKQNGMELVGNLVRNGKETGGLQVVEYMHFPEELALQTNPDGTLRFWAGSIGVHLIQLDFLEKMAQRIREDWKFLPYNLPVKKILAENGECWGIKPERFIFDVLPFAKNALAVKALNRGEVFTTLKNEPEPVREHLSKLYASWLRQAGAEVPRGAKVEIAPEFALDFESLREKIPAGTLFTDSEIYLHQE